LFQRGAVAPAVGADNATDPAVKAALSSRIDSWRKTVAHYEDEADPPEGRKQLMALAKKPTWASLSLRTRSIS
jgi:hypothetical protein